MRLCSETQTRLVQKRQYYCRFLNDTAREINLTIGIMYTKLTM
jgi:hypothetical protein